MILRTNRLLGPPQRRDVHLVQGPWRRPRRRGPGIETPRSVTGASFVSRGDRPGYFSVALFLAFGAAFAVALGAALAVLAAAFFGVALVVAFAALALAPLAFERVALAGAAFVALALAGVTCAAALASAALAAAASARAVLLRAARALPAAVCAPLALPALPAAMRAFAAFWAAILPVDFVTWPPAWTCVPLRAAFTLRVETGLATRGGVRMDGAGLGRAIEGAERVDQRHRGIDGRVAGSGRDGQGLRDVRLRRAAARLEDFVAALGLTDALES